MPESPGGTNQRQMASTSHSLSWILATCPDDSVRDGAKAVRYAIRACELTEWENAEYLDTLAAAYAEAGDFLAAVKWQKKAMQPLGESEDRTRTRFQSRLELYRAKKPYRVTRDTPETGEE